MIYLRFIGALIGSQDMLKEHIKVGQIKVKNVIEFIHGGNKMTNGAIFNPAALAGTVYGIAGAGISLSLLAGMARGVQDITYGPRPTVRASSQRKYKSKQRPAFQPYKHTPYRYKSKYTW